ncbi:hypothetical protein BDU57DRAFT_516044 [Ampelomyces quisqualis]|uniref:Complex I intermediate-associated protein-like protein 84 n=1 Tax=Ampelomyces quisqualis TaxID=50730 RepID=A0A6A5QNQ0_AMPQU|nr:hypothetical protein BDU57DRAFT_516044 [Ampelomyces quisqualis]
MPSHLTRLVFRRLIANEPLTYRACRLRAAPHVQRRPFFELFKQRRKLKPMVMPAGLDTLAAAGDNIANRVRPPEAKAVADAFKVFFAQRKGPFEGWHVAQAHRAFSYLLESPREDGGPWLSAEELRSEIYDKLVATAHRPEGSPVPHIQFGKALLDECTRQDGAAPAQTSSKPTLAEDVNARMVRLLSAFGAATEARDLATESFRSEPTASVEQKQLSSTVWSAVLAGIVREGHVEEVQKTADLLQRLSIPITTSMQHSLVSYFCGNEDVEKAKFWYEYPVTTASGKKGAKCLASTHVVLLKACARSGNLTLGQEVVAALLKGEMPEKGAWDAIFLWSAAIGKGPDEVDRMMSVMTRRNDEARQKNPSVEPMRPDVETMNILVEFAMSKQDPYMAERYVSLSEKRGIMPDERTYAMQIQYRLSVMDLDGARAAYYNLRGEFSGADHSVKVVNSLIQALCNHQQHHFDDLMVMVDDLHERKARFEPETIAAVCILHLRRGEMHDAVDILQVHAHQFSPDQRAVMRKGLANFILDGETSTADAWETYQILRNVFPETSRARRIDIMNNFFSRKRSDMACHVFFHMRNHESRDIAATSDVYVAAFVGFARCADAESLELAHNQLKLDMHVDFDTRLRNALMLAYAAVGENNKAMRFWREICESKEGPTYNSIAIAFRACETMHHGYGHARSIWKRLKEQDVEIDKAIWTAYMSAMARNFQHDDAQALIESVEEEYGFPLDLQILGSWFNSTASNDRQERIEAWIKERYPEIWKELEALGHWVTMDGFGWRQYNINRDLDP